jgi:hypothetical protein
MRRILLAAAPSHDRLRPPVPALERIRQNTQPRFWSALYQQRPAPEEGNYFKADWLRPYETMPARETLKIYGASDYAVTANGGDYTVHIVVGVDPEWRIYVLDLWRAQTSAEKWIETFCDLVRQWKPIGWAEEQGHQIRATGTSMQSPLQISQQQLFSLRERSVNRI